MKRRNFFISAVASIAAFFVIKKVKIITDVVSKVFKRVMDITHAGNIVNGIAGENLPVNCFVIQRADGLFYGLRYEDYMTKMIDKIYRSCYHEAEKGTTVKLWIT